MYRCIHIDIHIICMYTCIYVYTYTHNIYIYTYIHIHICVHDTVTVCVAPERRRDPGPRGSSQHGTR